MMIGIIRRMVMIGLIFEELRDRMCRRFMMIGTGSSISRLIGMMCTRRTKM